MKVLFVHEAEKAIKDNNGNFYTDGSYNSKVWKRYLTYFPNLTVLFRENNYTIKNTSYNKVDSKINVVLERDYRSFKGIISFKKKKKTVNNIEKLVITNDLIIIRLPGAYFSRKLFKLAKKHKKKILIEVVGCAFNSLWYHSFTGKILALPSKISMKKIIKKSDYVHYVTSHYLQKIYPTNAVQISLSDVTIAETNNRIRNLDTRIINIGTAGIINIPYKGHKYVIEALGILKKKKIIMNYYLAGSGEKDYLYNIAKKNNVVDQVYFLGLLDQNEIIEFYINLDLYVQPSLTEGLPRSIIESISYGTPVIGSEAGGIPELISDKYIFKTKSSKAIAKMLIGMESNYHHSRIISEQSKILDKYNPSNSDQIRDEFYKIIILEMEKHKND